MSSLDSICLRDDLKAHAQTIIDALKSGKGNQHNTLLQGKPGLGKKMLAKSIAREAKAQFFEVRPFDDSLQQALDHAETAAVIFIENIGRIATELRAETENTRRLRQGTTKNITIIGAVYDASMDLDQNLAFFHPEIQRYALFSMDPPTAEERQRIIEQNMLNFSASPATIAALVQQTEGYTGAEIADLINDAKLTAIQQSTLTIANFSLPEPGGAYEPDYIRLARHEAGHAVVAFANGCLPSVTSMKADTSIGYRPSFTTSVQITPPSDILASNKIIQFYMGGRAAEELHYGANISSGAADDILEATKIARNQVARWLIAGNAALSSDRWALDQAIENHLKTLYQQTQKIVSDNQQAINVLAASLLTSKTMTNFNAFKSDYNFKC